MCGREKTAGSQQRTMPWKLAPARAQRRSRPSLGQRTCQPFRCQKGGSTGPVSHPLFALDKEQSAASKAEKRRPEGPKKNFRMRQSEERLLQSTGGLSSGGGAGFDPSAEAKWPPV